MLPESEAPPLAHYDEFKAFMEEREINCRRVYVPAVELEDGEVGDDYWTVLIYKEQPLADGRIAHVQVELAERLLAETEWPDAWALEADLLGKRLEYLLEDEGLDTRAPVV